MNRILVDRNPHNNVTRTALMHGARLVEVLFSGAEASVAGNIYAGLVDSILPSRFAFVNIGLEKNAFLYIDDSREADLFKDENGKPVLQIKPGQTILVQALKDPSGEKGAYVTGRLGFKGRFVVLSKLTNRRPGIGISKKIEDAGERKRLKRIVAAHLPEGTEAVVRTNAAGCAEAELAAEIRRLSILCQRAETEWQFVKAPALLQAFGAAAASDVSELFDKTVDEIVINDTSLFTEIADAAAGFFAGAEARVKPYDADIPLFSAYGAETQIEKALQKRVWLKSGGFLVIEQTEACAVIDVNTGKYAGKKDHEQSVLTVNLEAAAEIARQLRLRNLGGIIIVDFIDMKQPESVQRLTAALSSQIKLDRVAAKVVGMTELGLMQMTRKKIRKPLAAEIYQTKEGQTI